MANKLGIIAGGGALPARLIEACRKEGREVFVVAIKGHAEKAHIASAPHAWVRLGAAGKAVELLHANGAKDLVLAGAFRRPSLSELIPDKTALQFIYSVGKAFFRDDALHTAVIQWLEGRGFHIVGPETIDRGLLATEGLYGRVAPDEEAWSDIKRGIEVARALGRVDVGQGVIVQQGVVLALEAVEGTDAMIARAGELKRGGRGGVLIKMMKPGQETRVDLPAIGARTVANAKAAGLRGIAIEAGGALVIDRDAVVAKADAAGLFVIGIGAME
ncbi:MAG TPA: UDP-2,3-diacylglucosamine diphosphatase LpxI [Alphaproteobacteria bacterium]|nr:UDP-2,3-diacylglucosamine diphosphatase LpxI [Alphaproteobacteria bacterium]